MDMTPRMDLLEFEGSVPVSDFKPIAMKSVTEQHRKKTLFRSSVGDVVLRKLSQMDRDDINTDFFQQRPQLIPALKEAERLNELRRRGIPLNAEHMNRLEDAARELRPQQRLYAMACFVLPDGKDEKGEDKWKHAFETLEDYDAFLTALDADEVERLYAHLTELTSIKSASATCDALLMVAKEFGIPIAKDLTLENMTAEQAEVLMNTLVKRGEDMQEAIEKAQDAQ
jgi:hypothetical protein